MKRTLNLREHRQRHKAGSNDIFDTESHGFCANCTETVAFSSGNKRFISFLHKKLRKLPECLGTLMAVFMYNNTCNPPNTLYSFLLHPISNKIPSPKELTYPGKLFHFLQYLCGFAGILSFQCFQVSTTQNSGLTQNLTQTENSKKKEDKKAVKHVGLSEQKIMERMRTKVGTRSGFTAPICVCYKI